MPNHEVSGGHLTSLVPGGYSILQILTTFRRWVKVQAVWDQEKFEESFEQQDFADNQKFLYDQFENDEVCPKEDRQNRIY